MNSGGEDGEQIQTFLEQQFELEAPTILQISGLAYSYDENAPEGERVGKITNMYFSLLE